jgi:aspartyl-tRNA(Asn)/glutamyl-tRNA(Gln) amidotransferase subunit A
MEEITLQLHRMEPLVCSAISVRVEGALADAALADKRWRSGTARPLEGLPIGVKDSLDTAVMPTSWGLEHFRDFVPPRDDPSVARLLEAGAILVAKLQIGYERANDGPFGTARNPWDLSRGVGGSSAGSASAVAARELPLTLGTDGMGSTRLPAAWAGVVGLKPTFGLVPMRNPGLVTAPGPLARTVADCELALNVMTDGQKTEPADRSGSLRGLTLGLPENFFLDICDGEVRRSFADTVHALEAMGAATRHVVIEHAELIELVTLIALMVPGAAAERDEQKLSLLSRRGIAWSRSISAGDYDLALRARHLFQRSFARAFETVDAIVMPGTIATAPRLDDRLLMIDGEPYNYFTAFRTTSHANATGLPALTVPTALSTGGMPIAIQIVGRPFDEATCFRIGAAVEQATDFASRLPPLVASVRSGAVVPPPPRIDHSRHVPTSHYGSLDRRVDLSDVEQVPEARDGEAPQEFVDRYVRRSHELMRDVLTDLHGLDLSGIDADTANEWLTQARATTQARVQSV